jgi:hypothetical protein
MCLPFALSLSKPVLSVVEGGAASSVCRQRKPDSDRLKGKEQKSVPLDGSAFIGIGILMILQQLRFVKWSKARDGAAIRRSLQPRTLAGFPPVCGDEHNVHNVNVAVVVEVIERCVANIPTVAVPVAGH